MFEHFLRNFLEKVDHFFKQCRFKLARIILEGGLKIP